MSRSRQIALLILGLLAGGLALPLSASAQTSLIRQRFVLRYALIQELRNLAIEAEVQPVADSPGNMDGRRFSRARNPLRDLVYWPQLICRQISLGDFEGARETIRSLKGRGNQASRAGLIEDPDTYIADWENFRVFLEHPDARSLENYEALRDVCIRRQLSMIDPSGPGALRRARELMKEVPPPDACVTGEGEEQTYSRYYALESWTVWISLLIQQGEIEEAVRNIESCKTVLARDSLFNAFLSAFPWEKTGYGKRALQAFTSPELRQKTGMSQVYALDARGLYEDAARELLDVLRENGTGASAEGILETSQGLIHNLHSSERRELVAQLLEENGRMIQRSQENPASALKAIQWQAAEADWNLMSGNPDLALEQARSAFESIGRVVRDDLNSDSYDEALAEIMRFVNRSIVWLVAAGDVETAIQVLDLTRDSEVEFQATLIFFREISRSGASMHEDDAFDRAVESLMRVEDLNARSSAVHDLVMDTEIALDPGRLQVLFDIGKTGHYRFEIIAGVLGRKPADSWTDDELREWEDRAAAMDVGENDDPDSAWTAMILLHAQAGRFERALEIALQARLHQDVNSIYAQLLMAAVQYDESRGTDFEKSNEVLAALKESEDFSLASLATQIGTLPEPVRARFSELWFSRDEDEQLQRIGTEDCYELTCVAPHLDLDLAGLERLYSRALAHEYAAYAVPSVQRALEKVPMDQWLSAIAQLKLAWVRDLGENVRFQMLLGKDPRQALQIYRNSASAKQRMERLEMLWNAWVLSSLTMPTNGEGLQRVW